MKGASHFGPARQLLAALLIGVAAAAPSAALSDDQAGPDTSQVKKDDELSEVLITAKRHEDTATKFDMSIIDVPQSVKVVTSDVLDFASVRIFNDLTKIDAATNSQGVYGGVPQITIRGFTNSSNNGIKVDGIPELNAVPIDLGVFDRIEILKGPTSTLYGQNAVGGLINAVSKQPLSTFAGSVQAQGGSFNFWRFTADLGGPLTQEGKLSYRAYGAYENGGTFVDHEQNRSAVGFLALKYNFDEATSATETIDYQRRRYTPEYGIAVLEGSLTVPDVPISRLYDVPWTYKDTSYLLERTTFTHSFSSNWKMRAIAEFDDSTSVGTDGYSFGLIDPATGVSVFGGGPAPLNGDWTQELQRQWSFETDLTGTFDVFGRSQTLFVGADRHFTEDDLDDACSSTLGLLNIYNPDYSALSPPRPNLSDWSQDYLQCQANNFPASSVDTRTTETGVTTQLLLHPLNRVSIMLGTRWDRTTVQSNTWVDLIQGNSFVKTGVPMPTLVDSEKWVSQAGLTYELHPSVNLYATWGQAFTPQSGIVYPNSPIPPEQGFQYEAGIKANIGTLTATLDVYDMERTHIEGVNFEFSNYVVDSGTEQSKGVEADIFGIILPGWTIYGSFASIDGHIIATDQGDIANIGARMQGVPKYGESLYSFYEVQGGPLSKLSFGGGIVSKQDIVWGLPSVPILGHQVDAGGYTTVDTRLSYEFHKFMFDLKANNVFNEKYYTSFAPALRTSIIPGRPREFIFGVRYKL